MFGKQHTLKQLSGGIAIAAFLAVVAVPSAFASTFITDTLGGNGSPKALPDVFERYVAIHNARPAQAQGMNFITDTLGGNGSPKTDVFERSVAIHEALQARAQARAIMARVQGTHYNPGAYVNGGATPQVAKAIQDLGNGLTPAPSVTGGSSGNGFSWSDAGLGAGLAASLLLLLLGGNKLRGHRRSVLTA